MKAWAWSAAGWTLALAPMMPEWVHTILIGSVAAGCWLVALRKYQDRT